jgi:DNA-binding transcriptional regulator YbjK
VPRKSDRRDLLADTALRLIDDSGLAQVTHREIDKAAGVPDGTTSNYFRTRSALYEAIVRRLLDLQLADLDRLAVTPLPGSPAELLDLLAATVEAGDGTARNRYLARVELSLEAARNPELAALMREMRAAAFQVIARKARAVHPHATDEQLDALGSVLTGLSLDRITLGVPAMSPRDVLAAVIPALLSQRHH